MVKVLIADDHQMFVDGLKSLLVEEKDMCVVGEAKNGYEVLEICSHEDVDIVIMDINMPQMDGIQTSRELSKKHPSVKILGLSMYNDRDYISDILKAGARGYVLKNTGKESLLSAIASLQSGSNYLSEEASKTLLNSFMKSHSGEQMLEKLSDREKEVLECIASGLTTHEIADKLFISKNTVETHRKNLLYKLKAKNTAELVNNAYKQRLIQ
ncbi:response regulator [Chryseosolibacter indicus]|uniref:Response regulator transcription factor n=1 Tax=Chryseosolibacter indicus TaxID=2782351 RepID=A0ABS5VXS0_9BACT|nr:response regulator transcription factor [Chryseosolibacter indicus]MBT1705719.1 response regulator transcription factor [Chryseosolibacter indicus]